MATEIVVVREPSFKVTVTSEGQTGVTATTPGPAGPPGPQGPPGDADSVHYTHTQVPASTAWTVNHNLGYQPNVAVIVDDADVSDGVEINHININTCMVLSNVAISGEAECS